MQISPIKNRIFQKNQIKPEKKEINKFSGSNNASFCTKIPYESLKANFLPFEGLKKVGEAYLIDKETGEEVIASIRKENHYNSSIDYELCVGRKKAGFMHLNVNSTFPVCYDDIHEYYNPVPYSEYMEVHHLRSLMGDKYEKIGSTLINIAIEESKKHNNEGAIWLGAEQGYRKLDSPHRSDENPIPFYYKMGFRAVDVNDEEIQKLIRNKEFDKLPEYAILVLTPDNADLKDKYHEKNFFMK